MIGVEKDLIDALRNSGLFDQDWYVKTYPDVRALGIDPLEHYVWFGSRLKRNPSPHFDTVKYLSENPDIAGTGQNPLWHFLNTRHAKPQETVAPAPPPAIVSAPVEPHRLKVAVISWDVGHNPLGRAYLLAEALARRFEVVLVGPSFPRFGVKVWEPVRHGKIPVIAFPGRNYPEFSEDLSDLASRLDCDVILACKPRMPSVHLGLLAKQFRNRPLILDIDDHELAFCKEFSPLPLDRLAAGDRSDLAEPYSSDWTRFAETLVPYADDILVSNEALQGQFGGTIIPHARDEQLFNPANYDREECRRALGLGPDDKMVFFAGTARAHKGIVEIANALTAIGNPNYKLGVLGTIQDRGLQNRIAAAGAGRVLFFPNQPLSELPKFLQAADLVCLLQNPDSSISHFQLPAKLIDAISMGVPVLATETPPLRRFISYGLVRPVTAATLERELDDALKSSDTLRARQLMKRELFLSEFSYEAVAGKMEELILRSLANVKELPKQALAFETMIGETAARPDAIAAPAAPRRVAVNPDGKYDMVMFWKQNDTGVYGRRSDMLAKYFARHKDIRQVLLIDAPLWHGDLQKRAANAGGISEHRLVYEEILSRGMGLRDIDRLTYHSFIYHPPRRHPLARWPYPTKSGFVPWLQDLFAKMDVDPARSIFWLFPVNAFLGEVVGKLRPKFVVSDVVDDQRAHPGLSHDRKEMLDANYRELLGIADMSVTNAAPLQQSMKKFTGAIQLLPNACETEEPKALPSFDVERLLAIPGPRLGYVGNLESKLDVGLLEKIAERRPDWNIVLVGSTHSNAGVLALKRFPNVHFMGVVRYDEARLWMRHFDVALMPHLTTDLTMSMNPLKLFVYMAQHVPVVSTPVPNTDEVGRFMTVARGADEFIAAIEAALKSGKKLDWTELDAHLWQHSWEARVDQAMKWIELSVR